MPTKKPRPKLSLNTTVKKIKKADLEKITGGGKTRVVVMEPVELPGD